jgi:hypothetical protein
MKYFVMKFYYFWNALMTYIPEIVYWNWLISGALVRDSSLFSYLEEFMYIEINLK